MQLPVLLLLLAACAVAVVRWQRGKLPRNKAKTTENKEEKPWTYPEPSPDLTFDLEKTEPPRFRAFRYAYKKHTIETRKLDKDSWVMLDNEWPKYYRLKVARLAARGDKIVRALPEGQAAVHELCQDLCEFLSRRYPQVYTITRTGRGDGRGWYGLDEVATVAMPALGAAFDLAVDDPLKVAGLIQPTDINVLVPDSDGRYRLVAMMLGIGGGQRLKDKLGHVLADLHYSGHVPHYKEQLEKPLDRYLAKLRVDGPVHRNTTAISTHDAYHWPTETMGPEDDWDPELRGPGVGTPSHGVWSPPGPISDISQLWFRQERQVLRRLPVSGAVVWMVHTYIEPMTSVAQEPGVPGRLAALVRSWDDKMAEHKGRDMYAHVLLPYLDSLHAAQVAQGVVGEGPAPSNFPF